MNTDEGYFALLTRGRMGVVHGPKLQPKAPEPLWTKLSSSGPSDMILTKRGPSTPRYVDGKGLLYRDSPKLRTRALDPWPKTP